MMEPSKDPATPKNQMTHFSRRFPADVETMIFEEVCNHERVVPIYVKKSQVTMSWDTIKGDASEPPEIWHFSCFRSRNPIPAILHVNVNARAIALRYYKLAFGVEDVVCEMVRKLDSTGISQPRMYINPSSDVICPESAGGSLWSVFMTKMKDIKARNIALNKSCWIDNFEPYFGKPLCPSDGSHETGWFDDTIGNTTLWTHKRSTNLYELDPPSSPISLAFMIAHHGIRHEAFYCCDAMRNADASTRTMAIVQMLQQESNDVSDRNGHDRQKLDRCPGWLYKSLDTWKRPQLKFLLHWN